MMIRILLVLAVVVTVIVLPSCIAKNNVDIEIPAQQKVVVVECYLTPGAPPELMLAESNTLDRELGFLILGKAQTYIWTDTGAIQLEHTGYQLSDRKYVVNYRSNDTIKSDHPFYRLDVTTADGVQIEASTSHVSPIQMQDVKVDEKGISVTHNINSTVEKYFKLIASSFKDGKHKHSKYEFYQQSGNVTNPCFLPWEKIESEADSVVVTMFHIQKDYYEYLQSVRNANSAYKDPFLTPEVIKSNIKGGVGIFTFYTYDKRGITL